MTYRRIPALAQFSAGVLALLLGAPASGAPPDFEVRPRAPAPGQVFTVRLTGLDLATPGAPRLRLGGRAFRLWPARDGWEGLACFDRDEAPGTRDAVVSAAEGDAETLVGVWEVSVAPREYGMQALRVDEDKVTLSPADQARAEAEAVVIRAALATVSAERLWEPPFGFPTAGSVSGAFGVRRVYNGKPRSYHGGLDIAAPLGAPVAAPAAGRVLLVGDYFYTGKTALVDHGLGLITAYFHLDSYAVAEGDTLERGALIGRVGSTGRSTGPHLHWGVYVGGVRADPTSLSVLGAPVGLGGESP